MGSLTGQSRMKQILISKRLNCNFQERMTSTVYLEEKHTVHVFGSDKLSISLFGRIDEICIFRSVFYWINNFDQFDE